MLDIIEKCRNVKCAKKDKKYETFVIVPLPYDNQRKSKICYAPYSIVMLSVAIDNFKGVS